MVFGIVIASAFSATLIFGLYNRAKQEKHYGAGIAYMESGQYEKAIEEFQIAGFKNNNELILKCYDELGWDYCPHCGELLEVEE